MFVKVEAILVMRGGGTRLGKIFGVRGGSRGMRGG